MTQIQKELAENADKNEPFERAVEKLGTLIERMQAQYKRFVTDSDNTLEQIRHKIKSVDDLQDKVQTIEQQLKMKKQEEDIRLRKLTTTVQELAHLEETLASRGDNTAEIQEKLKVNNEQLGAYTNQSTEAQNEVMNIRAQKSAVNREIKGTESEISIINSSASKQMEILRRVNADAFKAVKWLRENTDQFSKTIHEPILTTITMKDQSFSKYIENHIPIRDMQAFVCEDGDDLNRFMSIVNDRMNLKVNAVLAPDTPLEDFKPQVPIGHIARFGFQYYIKDLFSAPDGVMRYCCKMHRIHMIPIGNMQTEKCLDKIFQETNLNRFYTDSRCYTTKQSRHGERLKSTMSFELKQVNLIVHSIDMAQLEQLNNHLNDLQHALQALHQQEQDLQKSEKEFVAKQEELRKARKALIGQRDYAKNLQSQIENKRRLKRQLELGVKDLKGDTENAYKEITTINKTKCDTVAKYLELLKARIALGKNRLKLSAKLSMLNKEKNIAQQALDEVSAALKDLEDRLRTSRRESQIAKDEATRALLDARKGTGITATNNELTAELKRIFGELSANLEDMDAQINQEQARADCILQVDKNVVREYESRKKAIAQMQKEVGTIQERMEHFRSEIEKIQNTWLPELNNLLERVNSNFSEFFARLRCVGEVSLKVGDNPLDFDKYGVCIKVKYRKEEPLHELSANHQSGGERSVATILYMMALQELTKVPFRCVDEINQGMDANNERKVFEFVVETACRRNTSQYFLLTPKLLPNLSYSENVMPHIIYNGQKVKMGTQWNVRKYIKEATKAFLSSQSDGS